MKKLYFSSFFIFFSLFCFVASPLFSNSKERVRGKNLPLAEESANTNENIKNKEKILSLYKALSKNETTPAIVEESNVENSIFQAISKNAINLKEVFSAAPFIYSLLFIMSFAAVVIWLYTLLTFRAKLFMTDKLIRQLQHFLSGKNYIEATTYCSNSNKLLAKIIQAGLSSRSYGPQFMIETMKSEGKRFTAHFWQRISLLNDIVLIAPMLGLLGTVLGMFYSFYDVNRSVESISALFDGLGVAVGTTVAGLIVAIIAMIFYSTLKYRLIRTLNLVENEALSLGNLIEKNEKERG